MTEKLQARVYRSRSLAAGTLACMVSSAIAQPSPATAPGPLEEIIVVARRVESYLQQTPVSVQTLSAEELELAGIDTGRELGIMVPNLVANAGGIGEGGSVMTMRGLPGVALYVDGVYRTTGGFLQRDFVELERVEVLRGPQGTLFGRNTNGGAIQLITRRPADEFGARISMALGKYNRRDFILAVDSPISDALKTKWTAASLQNDGFLESLSVPRSLGEEQTSLLRGDVLWQPSDRFSLRWTADEVRRASSDARITRITDPTNIHYTVYNVLAGNPDFLSRARVIDPNFPDPPFALAGDRFTPETHESGYPGGELGQWQTRSDTYDPTLVTDTLSSTLTLRWEITRRLSLESLTSHNDGVGKAITDFDSSKFTITKDARYNSVSSFSQELHLFGDHFDGRVNWLLGTYYSKVRARHRFHRWGLWEFAIPNTGPNPNPRPGQPGTEGRPLVNTAAVSYVRTWGTTVGDPSVAGFRPFTWLTADLLDSSETVDRAVFGEIMIGLAARLHLTLGFRISDDDGWSANYAPSAAFRPLEPGREPVGDLFAGALSSSDHNPDLPDISTPKVSMSYQPTDDLFVYASYAEGFTSGSIVEHPFLPEPVILDPEIVETREIGLRSNWLNRRLRLNATYFDSDWKGFRVPVFPPDPANPGSYLPFLVTMSQGLAKASGFEAEIAYVPNRRWRVNFGLGLLNTAYQHLGDPPSDGTGLQPGVPFQYAPERSVAISLQHRMPLTNGGQLTFAGSYGWMDDYQRGSANEQQNKNPDGSDKPEPAYGLLNARIVFAAPANSWHLSLFGSNLTNAWYVNGGFDARSVWGYDFATIGRPREIGVGLQFFL